MADDNGYTHPAPKDEDWPHFVDGRRIKRDDGRLPHMKAAHRGATAANDTLRVASLIA